MYSGFRYPKTDCMLPPSPRVSQTCTNPIYLHSLADSFARAGFLTITPDLFDGVPAPHDITFDAAEFLSKHNVNVTDPIIEKTIEYIRTKLGVKRVAVTGYCFGGRYAFRFLAEGRGVDVGFAAHPSLLQDDEVLAIRGPASVAAAGESLIMERDCCFFLRRDHAYKFL